MAAESRPRIPIALAEGRAAACPLLHVPAAPELLLELTHLLGRVGAGAGSLELGELAGGTARWDRPFGPVCCNPRFHWPVRRDARLSGRVWEMINSLEPYRVHENVYALAQGKTLLDATRQAKDFMTRAIGSAPGLGHGYGPVNHWA